MTVLEAAGLGKHYPGAAAPSVAGVDLRVAPGSFVSITGRSGSGKSTLLAMLGGLARPSAGTVRLEGRDLWAGLDEAGRASLRRTRLATITQQAGLLPTLRAADNVALPALLGGAPRGAADAAARAMLGRVGLAHRADAYPGELSGGEQRRVAIARALAGAPAVVLADEPTGDLDAETEAAIVALIDELRRERGFALVLVTHNAALAARADQRLVMDPGGRLRDVAATSLSDAVPEPARSHPPAALGAPLRRRILAAAVPAFVLAALALAADRGLGAWRAAAARDRQAQAAETERRALSALRTDIAWVQHQGSGRYEVGISLENAAADGRPLFVLEPRVQAFVQDGLEWQPLALRPLAEATTLVREARRERQVFRYALEARPERFTPLLRHYMHIRFRQDMQVSLEDGPGGAATPFRRTDNHYIHLKPHDADDAAIRRDVRFPEAPPLWIWMPPH